MRIFAFIIISFICAIRPVIAQNNLEPDTVKGKYKPTGIRIGVDLISAGQGIYKSGIKSITQGAYQELQFSADIDFYRYFLNFEYGVFDREWIKPDGLNAVYKNSGSHFKIGPDVNFLHKDPDGSALFFGMRYAWSGFSDQLTYDYSSGYWGDGSNQLENTSVSAHWFELTTGLKVKLTRILWMGYTARFKFGINSFEKQQLVPHWVPGFGLADEKSFWGLDYWLIFRVPLKKDQ